MAENGISSLNGITAAELGVKTPIATKKRDSLDQADFFKLLVTQMKSQDPTKPQDSNQFASQIAQFGTLDSVQQLQKSFTGFSNSMQSSQALQASSLVGRSVVVDNDTAPLLSDGNGIRGYIKLDQSVSDLKISVYDSAGSLVKKIPMGVAAAGLTAFKWDGTAENGAALAQGSYRFLAEGTVDDKPAAQQVLMLANVNSVLIGQGTEGIKLNLDGIGEVPLDKVTQIGS